ncbi:MAG TPA: ABC transporter ATP-binding protein [Chthonomonadaceae bacterium]|nr:ABC transporter ATP-binding protein [Chthonomonadaceae bacterium]
MIAVAAVGRRDQAMEMAPSAAEAIGLTKVYRRGVESVHALSDVSFRISRGEFIAIVGPSGAGKTTLLHLLGCMDTPTSGRLVLDGQAAGGLSDGALTRLRREKVGFVFQHFGLLPTLTVLENVMLPALFSRRQTRARAAELLEQVGIGHRAGHRPHELSGGEMQRAAIARALINSPALLLADEPTGNLDSANGEAILALFQTLNRAGITIAVVTHNPALSAAADRQLTLRDGRLASDSSSIIQSLSEL